MLPHGEKAGRSRKLPVAGLGLMVTVAGILFLPLAVAIWEARLALTDRVRSPS